MIVMTGTGRIESYGRLCCRSAKKHNRGNGEGCRPLHCAPSYHFVIAVWRLKAAQFDQREVLGSHRAGWSWGCVATVDSNGQTIFVADAHRDNGKRFIVTADEKLRAFLELQRVTRESLRS
jgi:hypothetical protein